MGWGWGSCMEKATELQEAVWGDAPAKAQG